MDNIDKIYYINLDRRTDRNEHLKKITKGMHNVQRVSAVDGKTLDLDKINKNIITGKGINDAKYNKSLYSPLTRGAIGCALSHRKIWLEIIKNKIQTALILEDDIRFDPNFDHKLNLYKKTWPKDYDIVFLGYHPASIKYINKNAFEESDGDYFALATHVYGLFGYIISYKGAEKLLKIFPLDMQIDTDIFSDNNAKLNIKSYVVKPNRRIIFSDPSQVSYEFGTDIQVREYMSDQSCYFDWLFIIIFIMLIIILIYIIFININNNNYWKK